MEPNEWNVKLVWATERFSELLACEAVVALDGGVGTAPPRPIATSDTRRG